MKNEIPKFFAMEITRFYKLQLMVISSILLFNGCSNVSRYKDIEYFPNGNVKKELIYRGNILKKELVKIIQYYPSDQSEEPIKQFELSYSGGAMNEQQKFWYNNGKQEMVLSYQYGVKHGKQDGWYDDGTKKFSSNYFFGKKEGIHEFWKSSGTLDRKKLYKSGKLIRIFKDW